MCGGGSLDGAPPSGLVPHELRRLVVCAGAAAVGRGARGRARSFLARVATANLCVAFTHKQLCAPVAGCGNARAQRGGVIKSVPSHAHAARVTRAPRMAAPLAVRRMAPADVLAFNAVNLDYFTETVRVRICVSV